jgi:hypothetical protein
MSISSVNLWLTFFFFSLTGPASVVVPSKASTASAKENQTSIFVIKSSRNRRLVSIHLAFFRTEKSLLFFNFSFCSRMKWMKKTF